MTGEMVAWFRQVLDGDEAAAKAATPGPWWADEGMVFAGQGDDAVAAYSDVWDNDGPGAETDDLRPEDARHIALHDPRQVLARIKAERAVLDLWELARLSPHSEACGALTEAVRALVSGYRHRPGYNPAWEAR